MSGPGYYRFRCKNFYTYNCDNWVWVNNSPCAACVAAGRESLSMERDYAERLHSTSNDINVPHINNGGLVYVPLKNVVDSTSPSNLDNDFSAAARHSPTHTYPSKSLGFYGRNLYMHD